MIKNYKLINGYVNLDTGAEDEKICNIEIEIDDEEIKAKIKNIIVADGVYYKDGWMIETVINEDGNTITGWHELFYIGENGREPILILEGEEGNENLIKTVDEFLLNELTYKSI